MICSTWRLCKLLEIRSQSSAEALLKLSSCWCLEMWIKKKDLFPKLCVSFWYHHFYTSLVEILGEDFEVIKASQCKSFIPRRGAGGRGREHLPCFWRKQDITQNRIGFVLLCLAFRLNTRESDFIDLNYCADVDGLEMWGQLWFPRHFCVLVALEFFFT